MHSGVICKGCGGPIRLSRDRVIGVSPDLMHIHCHNIARDVPGACQAGALDDNQWLTQYPAHFKKEGLMGTRGIDDYTCRCCTGSVDLSTGRCRACNALHFKKEGLMDTREEIFHKELRALMVTWGPYDIEASWDNYATGGCSAVMWQCHVPMCDKTIGKFESEPLAIMPATVGRVMHPDMQPYKGPDGKRYHVMKSATPQLDVDTVEQRLRDKGTQELERLASASMSDLVVQPNENASEEFKRVLREQLRPLLKAWDKHEIHVTSGDVTPGKDTVIEWHSYTPMSEWQKETFEHSLKELGRILPGFTQIKAHERMKKFRYADGEYRYALSSATPQLDVDALEQRLKEKCNEELEQMFNNHTHAVHAANNCIGGVSEEFNRRVRDDMLMTDAIKMLAEIIDEKLESIAQPGQSEGLVDGDKLREQLRQIEKNVQELAAGERSEMPQPPSKPRTPWDVYDE